MHLVDGIILPLFANVFFTIISFKITKNCTGLLVFTKKTSRKMQFSGNVCDVNVYQRNCLQQILYIPKYARKPASGRFSVLSCFMFFLLHMHLPVLIRRISIHPFECIDQSSGIRKSTIQRNVQN